MKRRLWELLEYISSSSKVLVQLASVFGAEILTCEPFAAAAAAKLLQSCPTLCDPIDGSPPGSTVPGILQARTLEWVAIAFSNALKAKSESEAAQSCPTLRDSVDCSPPGSSLLGFSRQEYWSGVPLLSPDAYSRWLVSQLS